MPSSSSWFGNKASAGHPDQSFTFDTGVTYASFIAGVNTSQIWADITAANTQFASFLASSDLASLQYAVLGGKSPGFGFSDHDRPRR